MSETTTGWLLGGRVRHVQPAAGHRTGLEPVLLAAAIPARSGQHVLEGGTGSGAGLLCLAARVPGISGTGIERDTAMADLAQQNAIANGWPDLRIIAGDLADAHGLAEIDHAFVNPPWHDPAGTPSPDNSKELAKRGAAPLLTTWATALARPLRWHGTLTMIVAAGVLPAALAAFAEAGCGSPCVLPFWPKPGRAAKLIMVHGVKGGRGACRVLPGLVLHGPDGQFTEAADAILRHGAALLWDAS